MAKDTGDLPVRSLSGWGWGEQSSALRGLGLPRQSAVIQVRPCVLADQCGGTRSCLREAETPEGLKTPDGSQAKAEQLPQLTPSPGQSGRSGPLQASVGSNLTSGSLRGSCISFQGFPKPGSETAQDPGQGKLIPWTQSRPMQAFPGSEWVGHTESS